MRAFLRGGGDGGDGVWVLSLHAATHVRCCMDCLPQRTVHACRWCAAVADAVCVAVAGMPAIDCSLSRFHTHMTHTLTHDTCMTHT